MPMEQVLLAFGRFLVSLAFEIGPFNLPAGAGGDPVPVMCPGRCRPRGRQRQQPALLRCKAELWLPFATQLCEQKERAGLVGQEGFRLSLGWSPPRDKKNRGDTIG